MKIILLTISLIIFYELFLLLKLKNNFIELPTYFRLLATSLLSNKLSDNDKEATLKNLSKAIIKKCFFIIVKTTLCLAVLILPLFWYVKSNDDLLSFFNSLSILFYMLAVTMMHILIRNKYYGK